MKHKIVTDIVFLRKHSEPVNEPEVTKIVKDLEDSLDSTKGYGLSAIQIGLPVRVGIVRMPKCKLDLRNPKVISKSGRFRFPGEGCLSVPGMYLDTSRYNNIVIENGDGKQYALEGIEACVVQHEIDHFDGKLFLDFKWKKRR